MTECKILTKEMLTGAIEVKVNEASLIFDLARVVADQQARQANEEPMLLAWYNSKTGEFSPKVECCDANRPAWLVYALSRGGDIIIDINNETYVFVYLGTK
jgi:hypothetical protein